MSDPSQEPVTTCLPSGENPPHSTELLCPANTCINSAFSAFHIHAVKSSDPASSTLPLGCHRTHSKPPPGPSSVFMSSPVLTFQMEALPSRPPVARRLPSWLNAMDAMVSVCALSGVDVTAQSGAMRWR